MANLTKPSWRLSPSTLPGGMHYAWVIVGILAIVQIVDSSISFAAGVMVAPLSDSEGPFGWSVGIIGVTMAVFFLTGAIYAPISGWLGDRYGPRRLMVACAILFAGSCFFLGSISHIWHFILAFGVMLSFTTSIAIVTLMAAISPWFRTRLGVASGLLWAAGGVGTALVPILMSYLLVNVGWQYTFWIIGGGGGGIVLLLSIFFRSYPADMGLKPYGALDTDAPPVVIDDDVVKLRAKVFNQHIRRTTAFWNLPAIHALGCAGHGIVLLYVIPIAVDRGIDIVSAGIIISIISLTSIISRLGTPILADLYGPKLIMSVCLLGQGLPVLMLFWAQDLWFFYLFAAVFGLAFGGEWTGYIVINRKYYGEGPIANCYGWQMSGAFLGHAITALLAGLIIYVTGSFFGSLVLSIGFSVAAALLVLTLQSTSRMLIPNWEESLPIEARSTTALAASGSA